MLWFIQVFIGYYSTFTGRLEYVDNSDKWHEDPLILGGFGAGFFVLLLLMFALSVWWCRKRDASSSREFPKAHLATSTGTGQAQDDVSGMSAVMRNNQSPNEPVYLEPVVFDNSYAVPTQPGEDLQHEYCTIGQKIDTKKYRGLINYRW